MIATSLRSCGTLGKFLNFSGSPFLNLKNVADSIIYFRGLLEEVNKEIHLKCSEQWIRISSTCKFRLVKLQFSKDCIPNHYTFKREDSQHI